MGEVGSWVLPGGVIAFKAWCIFLAGKSQTAQRPKVLFVVLVVAVVSPNLKDEWSMRWQEMTMLHGNNWIKRFSNKLSPMLLIMLLNY